MARRRTRTLTEFELEIMQVVWQQEEITVEEVRQALEEQGKRFALPTIRTMLTILERKGYVTRRNLGVGRGRIHAYRAVVSQDKALKRILKDMVERAFEGSAMRLMAALVKGNMISSQELAKVRKLIREREKGKEK